jgi:hypothetical protein
LLSGLLVLPDKKAEVTAEEEVEAPVGLGAIVMTVAGIVVTLNVDGAAVERAAFGSGAVCVAVQSLPIKTPHPKSEYVELFSAMKKCVKQRGLAEGLPSNKLALNMKRPDVSLHTRR